MLSVQDKNSAVLLLQQRFYHSSEPLSGDPEYRYTKYLKQPRKTDDDNYDEDEYVDFEAPLPPDGYITEKLYLLKPLKEFHI